MANQSHHAIEMFLKGFLYYNLAMQRPDEEPERISKRIKDRFSHRLPKLWEAFKRAMSAPELAGC